MRTKISKLFLVLPSLLLFAACAKKAEPLTSDKTKPKKEAAATDGKTPKPEAPRKEITPPEAQSQPKKEGDETGAVVSDQPAKPNPAETNSSSVVTAPAPEVSGVPGPRANSAAVATTVTQPAAQQATGKDTCPVEPGAALTAEQSKLCTPLLVEDPKVIEACLLEKVVQYSTQLKTENREINTGSLNWVVYRAKADCHGNNLQDQEILKRVHLKLKEIGLELFSEASEVINSYVAQFLPKPAVAPPAAKVVSSTEYHFAKVLQYGSRDFRQPKDAVNYSIGKIQRTINMTTTFGEGPPIPQKSTVEWQKDIFSNLSAYSFGFELKSNKMYTLEYKDETGSLTLDYNFFEGSLEAFKSGDSARVVLTKASWLKVIEFETQKLLAKHFAGIPRSSLRITLSPLDPPTTRTCSIGKGFILGYRAIACIDPEYRVRIQVLDTGLDTTAPTSAQ